MKLSASNIGWAADNDEQVWQLLKDLGYQGIEIAPTRKTPTTARRAQPCLPV